MSVKTFRDEGFYLVRIRGHYAVRKIGIALSGGYIVFMSYTRFEKVRTLENAEIMGEVIWVDKTPQKSA